MSRVSALAINAADHLVSKGRLDAAASILRNYLSTNSPRPDILQRLGRILLAQGRSSEAIPLLQQALNQFHPPAQDAEAIAVGANRFAGAPNHESSDSAPLRLDAEAS